MRTSWSIDWLEIQKRNAQVIGRLTFCLLTYSQEVSALANECAAMLLDSAAHPAARCRLLGDLIELGLQPINLAALQLLRPTFEDAADDVIPGVLAGVIGSLLKVSFSNRFRVSGVRASDS